MFSTTEPIKIKILSGGVKECVLSWPTDEQWESRAKRMKTVRRARGRGEVIESPNDEPLSIELFNAIRKDDGPEFDGVEASKVIGRLETADVAEVTFDADHFTVTLDVFGGNAVTHVLKMPTLRQAQEYGRAAVKRVNGFRESVTTTSLMPGAALYDKLMVSTEGYDGPVPIIHKDAAVMAVLLEMDRIEQGADPEA